MPVIKRFKALLRFVNVRYYRKAESVLKGVGMTLNQVFILLYIVDIQNYTIIDDGWGIGLRYANTMLSELYLMVGKSVLFNYLTFRILSTVPG